MGKLMERKVAFSAASKVSIACAIIIIIVIVVVCIFHDKCVTEGIFFSLS